MKRTRDLLKVILIAKHLIFLLAKAMNFIGIDVGTSSVKALVDKSGVVIKKATPEYDFSTPKSLWAEANPSDWWEATQNAIKTLLVNMDSSQIGGIGLTGQMHGMVVLDKGGNVLRPCIMWNDQRSHVECNEITNRIGREKILKSLEILFFRVYCA